jgi:hypothetical protein
VKGVVADIKEQINETKKITTPARKTPAKKSPIRKPTANNTSKK